jgi:hypothetical protein
MDLLASWARSTVANFEKTLSRFDEHLERLLLGAVIALALVALFLFSR